MSASVETEWLKQNPKSEGRNPEEIRSPKSENAPALPRSPGDACEGQSGAEAAFPSAELLPCCGSLQRVAAPPHWDKLGA
jgi:hypothetical protein